MAESKAEKAAGGWNSRKQRHDKADLKGLPEPVQKAILDVEAASWDIHERVELAEQLWETEPDHELALDPDNHRQTSWAQQYANVNGEIVEVTKESATDPVKVIYRPELVPHDEVDPASALQARLQAEPDPAAQKAAQQHAEQAAASQVRED